MTSTSTDVADRHGVQGNRRRATALVTCGRIAAVFSLVLCLLLQAVNHDFFPPQVSVSQYGIGPRGWVFTCWAVVVAVAAAALHAGGAADRFGAGRWIATGGVALVIMGAVRTDANGLQQSLHAKVHMAASIVALVALPIGMALAMDHARAWLRRTGWLLVSGISVALVMVLVSAAGVGTPGFDVPQSWALWQAVAVTLDMVLIAAFGLSSFPRHQEQKSAPGRPGSPVPPAGAHGG